MISTYLNTATPPNPVIWCPILHDFLPFDAWNAFFQPLGHKGPWETSCDREVRRNSILKIHRNGPEIWNHHLDNRFLFACYVLPTFTININQNVGKHTIHWVSGLWFNLTVIPKPADLFHDIPSRISSLNGTPWRFVACHCWGSTKNRQCCHTIQDIGVPTIGAMVATTARHGF